MRKIYSLFLLLGLLLSIGNVWGAEVTYDFSTGGVNSTSSNTWTTSQFTILQEKGSSATNVANYLTAPRWYKDHTITITPAINITITQIVVNCSAANYNGQEISASVGSVSKNENISTWTGSITSESPVVLTMGKQCRPSSIVVTYSASGAQDPVVSVVPANVDFGKVLKDSEVNNKTVTVTGSYLTSNLHIAATGDFTVSPMGEVTVTDGNASETVTISAASTTTTGNKVGTITISGGGLTENKIINITMSVVTPMTVAEALTAINALADNGAINDSYVSGIVCTEGSLSSGQITYYISDDGTETNRLQVYNGKGLNNANFVSADDIQLGDLVIVFGQLKKYVNKQSVVTPEINAGNYLISLYRKSISSIVVKTAPTKLSYKEGETFDPTGLVITATYDDASTEDIPYAGNVEDFTFTPSGALTTENTSIQITYDGKSVNQAITVAPAPHITLASYTLNVDAKEHVGSLTVTYENITNILSQLYFYEADGTTPAAYNWIAAEINDQTNNIDYIIATNTTDEIRTAYMKVYALDDEGEDVYSPLITISQAAHVSVNIPLAVLDFTTNDFDFPEGNGNKTVTSFEYSNGTYTVTVEGSTGNGYYWNGYLLMGKTGASLTLPAFPFNVSKIKVTGTSGASSSVKQNIYVGDVAVSTETTGAQNVTNEYEIAADKQAAGTIYVLKVTSNHNTQISEIEVEGYYSFALGEGGYSTYANDFKYEVTGAEVYKAAVNGDNSSVVLTPIEDAVVPVGEGIILKGTAGNPVMITPSDNPASNFTDNELVGVLTPTIAPANAYVLATNIDGDGLTKFNPCDANLTIPANKAFIEIVTDAQTPAPIRIEFAENNATNIQNLEAGETAVKFFENGQLFIKRNGVVYTATGAVVK